MTSTRAPANAALTSFQWTRVPKPPALEPESQMCFTPGNVPASRATSRTALLYPTW